MNRVGIEGHGESIWLAWFLYHTLTRFAALSDQVGQRAHAELYRKRAAELKKAVELHGWDGGWYLRAFYDDGSPLGSHKNRECQIDAIAQSWAVISGAADPRRAAQAMAAVYERLIRVEDRLLLLFAPPFDRTPRDPGYIKGYLPGIRENGGQYTHAALWTIWAFAEMGQGDRAAFLFQLINPICRADSREKAAHYRVEPYVITADVYGVAPHTGRGGWSWYTGSSGWMYRLGIEAILGLRRQGDSLLVEPCVPRHWPGYTLRYRFGRTIYDIRVVNGAREGAASQPGNATAPSPRVVRMTLDGQPLPDGGAPLQDDGHSHQLEVLLGDGTL
jgi:cyclic beta-1,2-glucan synthetase